MALNSSDAWWAALSDFTLRCYLAHNRSGQLSLAATFMPLPSSTLSPNPQASGEGGAGAAAVWSPPPPYGHVVLQALLALFVPLSASPDAPQINPLQRVCRALKLISYLIRGLVIAYVCVCA
jgi:hypothetical protein